VLPSNASFLSLGPAFFDATTSEVESLDEDCKEMTTSRALGDMPLIVITASDGVLGSPRTSALVNL
jgi:hypothetical protein